MKTLRLLLRWWRSLDYKLERELDRYYHGKISDGELAQRTRKWERKRGHRPRVPLHVVRKPR